jgi:mono/diheme cytochrome c family protein
MRASYCPCDRERVLTEVPEHLLRRAKERRAAAQGGSASEAGAPATDATSKAVEPASAATPAPAGGGSGGGAGVPAQPGALEPPYTGPPAAPPRKQRVPAWAMPVLVALPLWAVLYGGAFGERSSGEPEGPIAEGAALYRAQGCSGCHGPTGGGGVGPAMDGVVATFPDFADHVEWIRTGSAPFKGQPYGAEGKIATGGMPGFPSLTEEELVAITCHERVTLAGAEVPPECEVGASPDAGEGTEGEGESGGDSASGDH